jgi:CHRD domain
LGHHEHHRLVAFAGSAVPNPRDRDCTRHTVDRESNGPPAEVRLPRTLPDGPKRCVGQHSQHVSLEFIRALRAKAAYGHVHTTAFPGGEIRGQVTFGDHHHDDD